MTTVSARAALLDIKGISERYPNLSVHDVLAGIPHTEDFRWKDEDIRAYLSKCPVWDWCQANHSTDDPEHLLKDHWKEVKFWEISVVFALSEGEPRLVWSPNFEEWTFDPQEADDLLTLAGVFNSIHETYSEFLREVGTTPTR